MNFPAASHGELNPADFAISTAHSLQSACPVKCEAYFIGAVPISLGRNLWIKYSKFATVVV
jgi:hypothetical protein